MEILTSFSYLFFYTFKNSKNSSAKYYRENKERLQKKPHEKYQNLSKRKRKKSNKMVMIKKIIKLSLKMKKLNWFSIKKYVRE